jgi:hypothetical protein
MTRPTPARCIHEPGRVFIGMRELSVSLPESKEHVQHVSSVCVQCGRVIFGLMMFLHDKPFGRVRWESYPDLVNGLRPYTVQT